MMLPDGGVNTETEPLLLNRAEMRRTNWRAEEVTDCS